MDPFFDSTPFKVVLCIGTEESFFAAIRKELTSLGIKTVYRRLTPTSADLDENVLAGLYQSEKDMPQKEDSETPGHFFTLKEASSALQKIMGRLRIARAHDLGREMENRLRVRWPGLYSAEIPLPDDSWFDSGSQKFERTLNLVCRQPIQGMELDPWRGSVFLLGEEQQEYLNLLAAFWAEMLHLLRPQHLHLVGPEDLVNALIDRLIPPVSNVGFRDPSRVPLFFHHEEFVTQVQTFPEAKGRIGSGLSDWLYLSLGMKEQLALEPGISEVLKRAPVWPPHEFHAVPGAIFIHEDEWPVYEEVLADRFLTLVFMRSRDLGSLSPRLPQDFRWIPRGQESDLTDWVLRLRNLIEIYRRLEPFSLATLGRISPHWLTANRRILVAAELWCWDYEAEEQLVTDLGADWRSVKNFVVQPVQNAAIDLAVELLKPTELWVWDVDRLGYSVFELRGGL